MILPLSIILPQQSVFLTKFSNIICYLHIFLHNFSILFYKENIYKQSNQIY